MWNYAVKTLSLGAVCAVWLTACGGMPETNPTLESARALYAQANSNPVVAKTYSAQKYLDQAREELEKAEKAEENATLEHHAYLAKQKAKQALEIAERKTAEQSVEQLSEEKDEIRLRVREKETAKARAEAERARVEAEARAREAQARAREAELALERVRQLEKELAAKETARGLVLTLGDVLFETGKAALLPGAARNIDKLADFLKQNPQRQVVIEGHTDSQGSDSYNMELSRNRANSVRNALLDRGVESTRLRTEGFGESRPVAGNDTAGGRQQNRRVEIIILK